MMLRMVLKHGGFVDVPIPKPEEFNFGFCCANVRLTGAFVNEEIYVPYDSIAFFAYGDMGKIEKTSRTAH